MSCTLYPANQEIFKQNLKLFLSKKRTYLFCLVLIIIFLDFYPLHAEDNGWINEGIDLTINNKFAQAIKLFQNELDKRTDDYRVYFYMAAAYNSRMVHFENLEDQDNFQNAIEKTIQIVEKDLDNKQHIADSLRADLLFYLGSAYGYRAYFEGHIGKWFPALSHGIKSSKLLNQAIKIDSSLYDAYLGIGTYKYWKYSKLNFISWLPFIPDDREEGIEMIKKAISKSRYSKYLAMHQLVYILLDFGRMEEAVQYAEKLIQKYPDSQFMWWALAHACFKSDKYETAERAYLHLMQLIENDKNKNSSHLLNCKLKLALIYKRMENNHACQRQCEELILLAQNITLTDKDEERLDQAHKLLEECDPGLK